MATPKKLSATALLTLIESNPLQAHNYVCQLALLPNGLDVLTPDFIRAQTNRVAVSAIANALYENVEGQRYLADHPDVVGALLDTKSDNNSAINHVILALAATDKGLCMLTPRFVKARKMAGLVGTMVERTLESTFVRGSGRTDIATTGDYVAVFLRGHAPDLDHLWGQGVETAIKKLSEQDVTDLAGWMAWTENGRALVAGNTRLAAALKKVEQEAETEILGAEHESPSLSQQLAAEAGRPDDLWGECQAALRPTQLKDLTDNLLGTEEGLNVIAQSPRLIANFIELALPYKVSPFIQRLIGTTPGQETLTPEFIQTLSPLAAGRFAESLHNGKNGKDLLRANDGALAAAFIARGVENAAELAGYCKPGAGAVAVGDARNPGKVAGQAQG